MDGAQNLVVRVNPLLTMSAATFGHLLYAPTLLLGRALPTTKSPIPSSSEATWLDIPPWCFEDDGPTNLACSYELQNANCYQLLNMRVFQVPLPLAASLESPL